jgi:monovalent cation:H+ antiporter-2, CPA2 family
VHNLDLILTLAGGFTAALILGYLTQRAGLSPIVGYLLAGTLVGPHTPGFVANAEIAEQLAEVGVILLMFGVGLQFHIEELLAVRRVAIPGAVRARTCRPRALRFTCASTGKGVTPI